MYDINDMQKGITIPMVLEGDLKLPPQSHNAHLDVSSPEKSIHTCD